MAINFSRHDQAAARIENRDDLLKHIAPLLANVGCVGEITLLRALAAGRINHWQMQPGSSGGEFKRYAAAAGAFPTIVSIPGDDYSDRGPEHWPAAPHVIRWARSIVVHASGAE